MRDLSKPLQEKAATKLSEKPEQLHRDLEILKSWLQKQEHLKCKPDDQLLVNFLRSSKFSIERAKEKLDAYYTFRTLAPEYARNWDPLLPNIQKCLNFGLIFPLAIPENNPTSPLIVIIRYGSYDPNETTCHDFFKTVMMVLQIFLNENDNFNVCGLKVIWDFKGFHYKTALQMTPTFIMKFVQGFEKCHPTRFKGVYVLNMSHFLEPFINFVKRIVSKKNAKRIHILSNNYLEEIHRNFPKSILPSEYGGDAGPGDVIAAKWKETVENYREMLLNENNYYSDESKRHGTPITVESMFGVDGSFRKLEID